MRHGRAGSFLQKFHAECAERRQDFHMEQKMESIIGPVSSLVQSRRSRTVADVVSFLQDLKILLLVQHWFCVRAVCKDWLQWGCSQSEQNDRSQTTARALEASDWSKKCQRHSKETPCQLHVALAHLASTHSKFEASFRTFADQSLQCCGDAQRFANTTCTCTSSVF